MIKCSNDRCSEHKKGCSLSSTDCDYFKFPPRSKGDSSLIAKLQNSTEQRITEDDVQIAVIEYCKLCKIKVVHIPNEGQRSKIYGGRLKRLGMSKGFPDLLFPKALNGYHGFYIELKRDEKAKPTPEQVEWVERLNSEGYYAVICHGTAEAIREINKYFKLNRNF